MGKLTDALNHHADVGFDTSIFIYQIEGSERYADAADEALTALAGGAFQGCTSAVTLMEVTVRPLQLKRPDAADDYEALISSFPNLSIVDIGRIVARSAAELRATYRLKPADALQIAACLAHGATAFLTNDRGLVRVRELEVVLLDDYVE